MSKTYDTPNLHLGKAQHILTKAAELDPKISDFISVIIQRIQEVKKELTERKTLERAAAAEVKKKIAYEARKKKNTLKRRRNSRRRANYKKKREAILEKRSQEAYNN